MEYYTLRQAAEQLKISKQGLKYWLDRLKIAHEKGESGRYIISSDALARIRAAREARGEATSEVVSEVRGEATSEAGIVAEGNNGESEENKEVSWGEVKGEAKGEVVSEVPPDWAIKLMEEVQGLRQEINELTNKMPDRALIEKFLQKIPDQAKNGLPTIQIQSSAELDEETPTAADEADKPENSVPKTEPEPEGKRSWFDRIFRRTK